MSLWRKTRTEVAGAYRSLRYDFNRPDDAPPADGPDVTSTGMNTFGGVRLGAQYADPIRPPRRVLAATSFGALALVGAAGSYFAVVNGLSALLGDETADPFPLAAVAPHAAAAGAESGLGPGTVPETPLRPVAPGTVTITAVPGTAAGGTPPAVPVAPPSAPAATPARTVAPPPRTPTRPVETPCDCPSPPVPTPYDPGHSPFPSPADPPSATPEPSESDSESESPSASPAPEPSRSESTRRPRRPHHD